MYQDRENQKESVSQKVFLFVGIAMALIYFVFGFWLLISKTPVFNLSSNNKLILGSVFILYSLYRGYIIYKRYFKKSKFIKED